MNVWFVRSNAEPIHSDSVNHPEDYVPGEPQVTDEENYRELCLTDGFARIGWPNTGPLQPGFDSKRFPDSERQAINGYSFESIEPRYQGYLLDFASIRTGDLILTPADTEKYDVHIGAVVRRDRATREILPTLPGLPAYYYFHDIPRGQPYECSHRVDVLWDRTPDGSPRIQHITGIAWRPAFCRVIKARGVAIEVARRGGLPIAI
jgi:hypothetical protein